MEATHERGFFDLVLRNDRRLDEVLRDEAALPSSLRKLLSLALLGLMAHGVAVAAAARLLLARGASPPDLAWFTAGHPLLLLARGAPPPDLAWFTAGHPLLWMPLAFAGAFVLALAVCLPSFYFYTQLAGLDASFRLVTTQALRTLSSTAVLLLGVLPFYVAFILAGVVGLVKPETVVGIGVLTPFVVGLFGIATLYRAFKELLAVLPLTHARRGNFLLRMVLAWGAVFTAVAPVALYRLGAALARAL
ncbi:MAG TPA: hypothetical protein VGQ83_18370 [Polyangia bacterium]|jgi:hypothetical protein